MDYQMHCLVPLCKCWGGANKSAILDTFCFHCVVMVLYSKDSRSMKLSVDFSKINCGELGMIVYLCSAFYCLSIYEYE